MATSIVPAPAERPIGSRQTPATADIDITRLWRAHVSPADLRGRELTVFVEAGCSKAALSKIAVLIAALEHREPREVEERIYNLCSAEELVAENVSEDPALRLFESGWSANRVICWIELPLVLVVNPTPLLRAWARIPQSVAGVEP